MFDNLLPKIGIFLILILAPIKMMLFTAGALVVADLVTGILAAKKRGEGITSQGLKRTVTKTLVYQFGIILAHLVETHMLPGVGVLKVVSGLIAVTELKSIAENVHIITGINIWAMLLAKLGDIAKYAPKDEDKK